MWCVIYLMYLLLRMIEEKSIIKFSYFFLLLVIRSIEKKINVDFWYSELLVIDDVL